jgi:SAM-dependent methyltransferase
MVDDDLATREIVRERYANAASGSCCSGGAEDVAKAVGYDDSEIDAVDGEANLGLGCGNPTAIANLEAGETVLDLGSGGGFDCFLAGQAVGPEGQVVGVDMTPEMVEKARANAEENDAENAQFRLGEIEHLPVADETVDVIISNCVVNLSPAKAQVYRETFRVLRPGGRLAISDPVRVEALPEGVRDDPGSLAGCISGAEPPERHRELLKTAGFEDIEITVDPDSSDAIDEWHESYDLGGSLLSATIEARKPE